MSSNILKVVGMDPSMSNFGFAKADLDVDTLNFDVTDLILTSTDPEKDKKTRKQVRKNSEDLDRARILHAALQEHCKGAWMAFVEVPHGSQSARAMASYGMCIGVLASCSIPLIQLTEREVKEAGAGVRNATKEEMIEWAVKTYPKAPWLRHTRSSNGKVGKGGFIVGAYKAGDPTSANEHLADATAAIKAGIESDQFLQVLSMLRGSPMFARSLTPA